MRVAEYHDDETELFLSTCFDKGSETVWASKINIDIWMTNKHLY